MKVKNKIAREEEAIRKAIKKQLENRKAAD
jgi:hypothetical protein